MVQRLWPHEVLVILNVSSRYRSFFDNKRIHSCISRTSSPSRVPSGQLCMTSKTKIQAWKAVPTALRRAGLPGQSGIGGASTAASEEHVHAHTRACSPECACFVMSVYMCSQEVRRLDFYGRLVGGRQGTRYLHCYYSHSSLLWLVLCRVAAWLEGLPLLLACAGPTGDEGIKEKILTPVNMLYQN